MNIFTKIMSLALAVTLLLMTACTKAIRTEGEGLEDAVKAYWTARIKKDPKVCYAYENMSLDKNFDEEYYTRNFYNYKVVVHDFEVLEIGKEASGPKDTTPVTLSVTITAQVDVDLKLNKMKYNVVDYWVKREDGKWYHMIQGIAPGEFQ